MRLKSDLVELCLAATDGRLGQVEAEWDERPALGVVMAAGGYPDDYTKGEVIQGLDVAEPPGCKVFHAGTTLRDGQVVTNGGRVLCVTALGGTVTEAQSRAYARASGIQWRGAFYRRDIGHRALARGSAGAEKPR